MHEWCTAIKDHHDTVSNLPKSPTATGTNGRNINKTEKLILDNH
jgi:hypothetical protein